jgi:hypothetical protein
MKELEEKVQNKMEISVKQKQQVEIKFLGKIMPHEGHKIWEVNEDTLEVVPAKYSTATAVIFGQQPKKEIIVKPNHSYISALTKATALRKFNKGDNGSKIIWGQPMSMQL